MRHRDVHSTSVGEKHTDAWDNGESSKKHADLDDRRGGNMQVFRVAGSGCIKNASPPFCRSCCAPVQDVREVYQCIAGYNWMCLLKGLSKTALDDGQSACQSNGSRQISPTMTCTSNATR